MKGFVSYSHDDYRMVEEFRPHLQQIKRAFNMEIWIDHRIGGGAKWAADIAVAIDSAEVFLLLVSPNFISSDYVYEVEIPAIRQRRQTNGVLVLPVILKRCSWQMIAAALQAIPTMHGRVKPISDWRPNSHGYDRTREEAALAIEHYFGIKPTRLDW